MTLTAEVDGSKITWQNNFAMPYNAANKRYEAGGGFIDFINMTGQGDGGPVTVVKTSRRHSR